MLTACPQCQQVIEIPCLNEHLLAECEKKENHRPCPHCREAIQIQHYDARVQRMWCKPVKPSDEANRCPLCHGDTPGGGEAGWKAHLLARGCPKNPRTLA